MIFDSLNHIENYRCFTDLYAALRQISMLGIDSAYPIVSPDGNLTCRVNDYDTSSPAGKRF